MATSIGGLLKRGAKAFLGCLGFEITRLRYSVREEIVLADILRYARPTVVVDVGANEGQYATLVRRLGFRGTIISFEAVPETHAVLCEVSSRDDLWFVGPCVALGSETGEVEMNIAENSVSSSVLPMLDEHVDAAPSSRYVEKRRTHLARLDELEGKLPPLSSSVMLKVDTQGYEKEVLKGAERVLEKVSAMQIEMSLTPLYAGAPGLTEMLAFVEELGFELFGIVPGLKNLRTGRLLQVDGFFLRPRRFDKAGG